MKPKETNNTNVEGVEMAQRNTPPSDKSNDRTAFVAPSDQKGEHGLVPLAAKNDGTSIANGLMLALKTGAVYTKNMSFVAGTTDQTSENFLAHNWTKRKIKLLFLLNKYLPTHKKAVREYKDGLDAVKLSDMQENKETFLNVLTQTDAMPLRELSLAVDPQNGNRAEKIEQTYKELKEMGKIETTYFFNGVIDDENIVLKDTGELFNVRRTKIERQSRNGTIKRDKNGKPLTIDAVRIIYNNLWLYGKWTHVPANVVELLDTYGNDTPLFLCLFIHLLDVRGTKTSARHVKAAINKKVAAMKKNNTRGELWSGFISNTVNKQTSALYTQQYVLDLLGKRNDGKQWYTTTKKFTDKKTGAVYTYENVFNDGPFQRDLTRAVDGCTNMGVLTVARVFTIPRDAKKAAEVVKEICKVFPGLAHNIKKLTPSDGVCCCVTFNGKWGYDLDAEPSTGAVEVKDDGAEGVNPSEPHNDGPQDGTTSEPVNA